MEDDNVIKEEIDSEDDWIVGFCDVSPVNRQKQQKRKRYVIVACNYGGCRFQPLMCCVNCEIYFCREHAAIKLTNLDNGKKVCSDCLHITCPSRVREALNYINLIEENDFVNELNNAKIRAIERIITN